MIVTHGVEVEVVGDTKVTGVAQTGSGTLLILENEIGAYAIFSENKAKTLHVHIPIKYLEIGDNLIGLKVDVVDDERRVREVLADLLVCLHSAKCYIDTELVGNKIVRKELRSVMPVISCLNKKKYQECMSQYDEESCSPYKGAPVRILTFEPFGVVNSLYTDV